MKFCCEKFAEAAGGVVSVDAPPGVRYPVELYPKAQIVCDSGHEWNVNGCCGGGCYVLTGLKFCPWCAAPLPAGDAPERAESS